MSNEHSSEHTEHSHSSHHHSGSHHHSSHHHSSSHHSSYSQPYGYGSSSSRSRRWKKQNKNAVNYSRKKKGSLNKSNKIKLIIAIIICVLILLAIAGYEIYNAYIVPNYVSPVLEEVVGVMQDEKYTSGITKEIQRLYDIGQISGPEIEQYLENHSETQASEDNSTTEQKASQSNNTAPQTNSTDSNTLGINSVKVKDNTAQPSVHYYSSQKKKLTPDNTVSMKELQNMSSDELYAKAKSIMSAEDFSAAMSLRSKISVSKVKELRNNSDALMQYIQSTLTADEYSNMLYIYAKYSNHLTN